MIVIFVLICKNAILLMFYLAMEQVWFTITDWLSDSIGSSPLFNICPKWLKMSTIVGFAAEGLANLPDPRQPKLMVH